MYYSDDSVDPNIVYQQENEALEWKPFTVQLFQWMEGKRRR